jgi:hypothetical protein
MAALQEGIGGISPRRSLERKVVILYKRHYGLALQAYVAQTPCDPGRDPKPMSSLPPSVLAGDPSLQPFELSTPDLVMQVVPALGGKVLSLVDRTFGTEWMWTPPDGRRLFRNAITDPFAQSTLSGADECFPTVAACEWKGRRIPSMWRQAGVGASASRPGRRSLGRCRCFLKTYETPE